MNFANFADLRKQDEVKFVIACRDDYIYACDIITKYNLNSKVDNILFSPVASDDFIPAVLADWIIKDRLNVRMQIQLHKILWDPEERGR